MISPELAAARRADPRYQAKPWRKGGKVEAIRRAGVLDELKLKAYLEKFKTK
jgi:hypothetical protein